MVTAQEALNIILSSVNPMAKERIGLRDAHSRVLAENIVAEENIPPFDNSSMDGFAVCADDVAKPPVVLTVVDEVTAGKVSSHEGRRGEAIRIMTGGQIPRGADAVVQIEWTEAVDDHHVRIQKSVSVGHNIRRAGEDVERGKTVLEAGRELRASGFGVLASLGRKSVEVYGIPRVAILATGNELVNINEPLGPGKIRDSNSFTLRALVLEAGAVPLDLGIAPDHREEIRTKILLGLEADVLVTSGGVSVGAYDLVHEVLKEIGVEIKFWKVNIKPGMPLLFGIYGSKPVFGLPGNPVSTMVTFLKFVKPALQRMKGIGKPESEFRLRAQLVEDIRKADGKRHFLRGVLETQNGALQVKRTGPQSSGVFSSLVQANCLIVIPEQVELLKKGDVVEVELL